VRDQVSQFNSTQQHISISWQQVFEFKPASSHATFKI
jgi:hypothetical protein